MEHKITKNDPLEAYFDSSYHVEIIAIREYLEIILNSLSFTPLNDDLNAIKRIQEERVGLFDQI